MSVSAEDLSRAAVVAVSLIPGAGALPVVGEVVGALVPIVARLLSGESIASIEADPLRKATGIDVDGLRADLEAAAK